MAYSLRYWPILFLWCLFLQDATSLHLQETHSMENRPMKKWKDRMALRRGQKEVVEDYEIGNNKHLIEQLIPLRAFLSQQLKNHQRNRNMPGEKLQKWPLTDTAWIKSIPNDFIEHRRKRDIDLKSGHKVNKPLNVTEKKMRKRSSQSISDKDADELEEDEMLFKDKEDHDDFFRNEYYRILAQSFATTRKKREADEENGERTELGKMTGRLEDIEDSLIEDAVDTIQEKSDIENVADTLGVAYDVENIRESLQHLKKMLEKIDSVDTTKDNSEKQKDEEIKFKEKKKEDDDKPISFHVQMNEKDLPVWNEYNTEEIGHVQPENAGFRPLPGFSTIPNSDLPVEKWKFFNDDKYDQECPLLQMLAKECSTLGDIMPEGNLRTVLLRACNWLEICYLCGKGYNLHPDDCDTGFLYGTRSVCEGDVPCQATGRLLFLSLRQTGVSQRSLPSMCYVDRCVERFLRQPSSP